MPTVDRHGAEARAVAVRTALESAVIAGSIDSRPRGREGEQGTGFHIDGFRNDNRW